MANKTAVIKVSDVLESLISNPSDSEQTIELTTFFVSNVSNSTANVSIKIERRTNQGSSSSTNEESYGLLNNGAIPPGKSTSIFLSKDSGVFLEPGDSLLISADAPNKVEAVCSYKIL